MKESPNIIWILLDACRAENLSCYGHDRQTTPNIDAIAERGVLFEQAYANANRTVLSVPSFLSGRYFPVSAFKWSSWRSLCRIPAADEKLISEVLRDIGYHTAAFSTHPNCVDGSRLAESVDKFQYLPPSPGKHYAEFEELNECILPWLDTQGERPFFLYVHSLDTHDPHYMHGEFQDSFTGIHAEGEEIPLPEDPASLAEAYDGSLRYADHHVGVLWDHLESLGLADNTILIVTSDHGEFLREDGATFGHPSYDWRKLNSDELFHVPLIMAGPGLPKGHRVSALAELVDVAPTLADLLGLENALRTDGCSLLPLLRSDGPNEIHEYLFAKQMLQHRDYDTAPVLILSDRAHKFVYHPLTEEEWLFTVPDRLGDRKELADQSSQEWDLMRARLKQDILPKWEQYRSLSRTGPMPFQISVIEALLRGDAVPRTAYAPTDPEAWVRYIWSSAGRKEVDTERQDAIGVVWQANPWDATLATGTPPEKTPPLTFSVEVPNGLYDLHVRVLADARGKYPASSLSFKAEDDADFKTIGRVDGDGRFRLVSAGRYRVEDGVFNMTLGPGAPDHRAVVTQIMFSPVAQRDSTPQNRGDEERVNRLRALGYVD